MANLPRGLWYVLLLWFVSSRPSAASRTESPHSGQWWATEEFSRIEKSAKQLRTSGNYAALEALYLEGIDKARQSGNLQAQTSYYTALGNTYALLYRYAEAVSAYRVARDLARGSGNWEAAGAVAPGLSSVYFLIGDWASARTALNDGLDATRKAGVRPYYEAQLKLQKARLDVGTPGVAAELLDAIEEARMQPNPALEAESWDLLGEEYLRQGETELAESALSEALRVRVLLSPRDLRLSYFRLGALRLAQNRLAEAEHLTSEAIRANLKAGGSLPAASLLHQRGRVWLAKKDAARALADFQAAARSAEHWRIVVPPQSRSSLTAADGELNRNIARAFIETAVQRALDTGEQHWVAEAFLAVERNRAASLRQSAELAEIWRRNLPDRYWTTLAALRAEESRMLQTGARSTKADSLHLELSEMEGAAGLGYSPKKSESFRTRESLIHFQQGLSDSELFVSFYVGAQESYAWAVTRETLRLYRLPSADRLEALAGEVRRAIANRRNSQAAEEMYQALFGALKQSEQSKSAWLLSLDGPLFEVPFAALRTDGAYVVEQHSVQVVPSAALLKQRSATQRGGYVGVGDPIYNWADSRLHPEVAPRWAAVSAPGQLNRLVSTGREVVDSARTYGRAQTLLLGDTAVRQTFLHALEQQPAAIHLATHIVADEDRRDNAFLAFSVGAGGSPELLGVTDIATLRVPEAVVVMTGCASGQGEARVGAGWLGLSRAWLAAGADAVVATQWPVLDQNGDIVPAFFRELSSASTAEALRRGQVEMIRSGTWQADPIYWAAFQVTGGAR